MFIFLHTYILRCSTSALRSVAPRLTSLTTSCRCYCGVTRTMGCCASSAAPSVAVPKWKRPAWQIHKMTLAVADPAESAAFCIAYLQCTEREVPDPALSRRPGRSATHGPRPAPHSRPSPRREHTITPTSLLHSSMSQSLHITTWRSTPTCTMQPPLAFPRGLGAMWLAKAPRSAAWHRCTDPNSMRPGGPVR